MQKIRFGQNARVPSVVAIAVVHFVLLIVKFSRRHRHIAHNLSRDDVIQMARQLVILFAILSATTTTSRAMTTTSGRARCG